MSIFTAFCVAFTIIGIPVLAATLYVAIRRGKVLRMAKKEIERIREYLARPSNRFTPPETKVIVARGNLVALWHTLDRSGIA